MRGTWNKSMKIPKHFTTNMRRFVEKAMEESTLSNRDFLKDWKDMLSYMSFTTTTFDNSSDAIYYFGKLNDAETSQQLNVGDLMRHYVSLVIAREPLEHARDSDIKSLWNEVEEKLKEERQKTWFQYS